MVRIAVMCDAMAEYLGYLRLLLQHIPSQHDLSGMPLNPMYTLISPHTIFR